VALAVATAQKYTDDWEVVIVNDGSILSNREALGSIVDILNIKYQKSNIKNKVSNRIRIIDHEKNRGYGGALRSGFAAASKDLIFYTDCDAQYDPRELGLLMKEMIPAFSRSGGIRRGEVGMVNGYKIKRNDPWYRTVAGRLYHHMVKLAFCIPIRDTDCDFRLIRREVFDKVKLFENTGTICTELVKKVDQAGYKIVEVPVHHYWRTSGKSQFFNFGRLFKTGTNLLSLWWKLIVIRAYDR